MEVLAVCLVIAWFVRAAVEDGVAAVRGAESPRITRKRARLEMARAAGVPTIGQAAAARVAIVIAPSPGGPRRHPALEYARTRWEDAWDELLESHHEQVRARAQERRDRLAREAERRRREKEQAGQPYDDTVDAEVVDDPTEDATPDLCLECVAHPALPGSGRCAHCRWGAAGPPSPSQPPSRCERCGDSADGVFCDACLGLTHPRPDAVDVPADAPTRPYGFPLVDQHPDLAPAPEPSDDDWWLDDEIPDSSEPVVHESNYFKLPLGPPDGPCGLGCERLRPADRCVRCSTEQDDDAEVVTPETPEPTPDPGSTTQHTSGTAAEQEGTTDMSTTVINGDVHDPWKAHEHATACATWVTDLGEQAEVCANNLAAKGVGPAAVGEIRGMHDDAATFLAAAEGAAGVFRQHQASADGLAENADLQRTVDDTYLDRGRGA